MRFYRAVAPTFWTGETGRLLRSMGRDEQLLALFLVTNPNTNIIGLYHLPLVFIAHYLNWTTEGAYKGLMRLEEGGFSYYDGASEVVFVPEMAAFQMGETISPKDKRFAGVIKEWNQWRKSKFYMDFYRRYKDVYCLPEPPGAEAPSKGLPVLFPLQEQEQEQIQEQEQEVVDCGETKSRHKSIRPSEDALPPPPQAASSGPSLPAGAVEDSDVNALLFAEDCAGSTKKRSRDVRPTEEILTPPLLVFPTDGKVKEWPLYSSKVEELHRAFPSLDILAECRKALAWIQALPSRRKTAQGMPKFLFGWMSKAQDWGGRRAPPTALSVAEQNAEAMRAFVQRGQAANGNRIVLDAADGKEMLP